MTQARHCHTVRWPVRPSLYPYSARNTHHRVAAAGGGAGAVNGLMVGRGGGAKNVTPHDD